MLNSLAPLALLACPIGMGVMMWFMSRGMKGERNPNSRSAADLRAERRALDSEIARLEADKPADERVVAGSS